MFTEHWEEMTRWLEERPDQTALELLIEFQARYPGRYTLHQLYTLQKQLRAWRREAIERLSRRCRVTSLARRPVTKLSEATRVSTPNEDCTVLTAENCTP